MEGGRGAGIFYQWNRFKSDRCALGSRRVSCVGGRTGNGEEGGLAYSEGSSIVKSENGGNTGLRAAGTGKPDLEGQAEATSAILAEEGTPRSVS